MTTVDDPAIRRALVFPRAVALLAFAAAAWITLTLVAGSDMTTAASFLPAWALMMAAMMLPAVAPVASLYVRTIPGGNHRRLGGFVAGYLLVWIASAVPAYGLSLLVMHQVSPHPPAARWTAAGIFAVCGIYQLTGLKDRCLRHCRSPLGQLMRYVVRRTRARPARGNAPRRLLPRLLLGLDAAAVRVRHDEPAGRTQSLRAARRGEARTRRPAVFAAGRAGRARARGGRALRLGDRARAVPDDGAVGRDVTCRVLAISG